MAQYKHHILSAKEIGKSLLLGTPDHSPFHLSIDAAQETLYYLNYLSRATHPSNGHAFVVQRSSLLSGHVPEHGTPTKIRKVAPSSTTTRAQAEAERQHFEEETNFTSPQAKEVPSTPRVTTFTRVVVESMTNMHQLNWIYIHNMTVTMLTFWIQSTTPKPKWQLALLLIPVTVAEYAVIQPV